MTVTPGPDGPATPPLAGRPAVATTEALRLSLDQLIAESQALRGDVHKAEKLRAEKIAQIRRENLINLVLLGGLSLFMVILLAVAYQNNKIAHDTKRNADTLIDCTTPSGKCYQNGRVATTAAITTLQRIQVYIVECSRALPVAEYPSGPKFNAIFEGCVQTKLVEAAATDARTKPSPAPAPAPTPSPAR